MKAPTPSQFHDVPLAHSRTPGRHLQFSLHGNREPGIGRGKAICPLTGSPNTKLLETFPTSLLIESYQRDLGLDVTSEFQGVQNLQLWQCLDSALMFFYPTMTGSEAFYSQLQHFDWYFPKTKFEYAHAATWIRPDHHVLDIGCGNGQFRQKIHPAFYTGLDPYDLARDNKEHIDTNILRESIAEHAIQHPQMYDAVCAFQVLEHIATPREFLAAALECLKPDGLLILGVPSAESYVTNIPNFVLNAPPHHVTWWTDKSLHTLATEFQLAVLDFTHAPVELWETRLYWMQRLAKIVLPDKEPHFTTLLSRRLYNIAAYLGAGIISQLAKPPTSAQGSTVIMVAQKKEHSCC